MRLVVLASTSPYRRQLLSRLLESFAAEAPVADEAEIAGEPPDARALRLGEEKALSLRGRFPDALIVGGDQTISSGGEIFDKPGTAARAELQLRRMRGRELFFHTAATVAEASTGKIESRLVAHRARLRDASDAEIARYVSREPALNCAGGAQIEGLGISLMADIRGGDPTALIGLPLIAVSQMLRRFGAQIP